jgi:hypothetical protein
MECHSLDSKNLPDGFDLKKHNERPMATVKEEDSRITVDYVFPDFYLMDETLEIKGKQTKFKRVEIASTGFLFDSGKPMLPSFGRYLQIPTNCIYRITAEPTGRRPIEFPVLVLPAQVEPKVPGQAHKIEYHSRVYSEDKFYPKEVVRVSGPFWVEGVHALLLHVCPFQYNPKHRRLIGYGNIRVTIEFEHKTDEKPDFPSGADGEPRDVNRLFLNPGPHIEKKLRLSPLKIFIPFRGPEFLIIYHDSLVASAQKLAGWKKSRGLSTEIISTSQLFAIEGITPVIPEENSVPIKQHLRSRMNSSSRLRYVLLLGDSTLVQPETLFPGYATDYYYSTSTGPQPSGQIHHPRLSIGRIPVVTQCDADRVVMRIIDYEKNPPLDPGYWKRITLAVQPPIHASDQDEIERLRRMDNLRHSLSLLGYEVDYQGPQPAVDPIVKAANNGSLFIAYRGHGTEQGWLNPEYRIPDLQRVTGIVPSVFYSVCCLTGKFYYQDSQGAPKDCFAEVNLKSCPTPSIVASTEMSLECLNNFFIEGLFDAIFPEVIPFYPSFKRYHQAKNTRLGDIVRYAKSYVATCTSSSNATWINHQLEMYHLLGDPTLSFPPLIRIEAEILKQALRVHLSSCPRDCVVSIWAVNEATGGKKLLKEIHPSSTQIDSPLPLDASATLHEDHFLLVTCWAPGHRFSQARVTDCAEERRRFQAMV